MKKIILSICMMGLLLGQAAVTVNAQQESATVYKPLIQMDFDTFSGVEEGAGSYKGYAGDLYIEGKPTAPIRSGTAPAGKAENTSLSADGAEDCALLMILGNMGNSPYFNANFSNSEFYGKLKMSFNYYIPSCESGNYGPLSVDLRLDSANLHNLFSVRGNKAYRLFPDGNNNNPQQYGTISTGKWYYMEYYFDADAGTYDVYIDGKLQGGGGFALNTDIAYKILRFYAVNNSGSGANLKNTSVYIDDLFFGRECEAPEPKFLSTANAAGEENTQQTNVEADMTAIKAAFPVQMDEKSFENNVTLTRGANNVSVKFYGEYDAESGVYTAFLDEQAMPCMQYNLTFGKKIISADKIPLGMDRTINVSTVEVPFAVTDVYFSAEGSDDAVTKLENGMDSVTVNVRIAATGLLEDTQEVTALAMYYDNGEMKGIWIKREKVIPPDEGTREECIELKIPLSGIAVDENTRLEVSVWDNYMNMLPLSGAAAING